MLVLGNAAIDLTFRVPAFPAPGETLLAIDRARGPGGKGLNQAVAASRNGVDVVFRAAIGRDPDGDELEAALAAEALCFEPLRVEAATDLSMVMVSSGGENIIATAGTAAAAFPADEAVAFARRAAPDEWLMLQGNLSPVATASALDAARGPTAFNAAPVRDGMASLLAACSLVVANAVEARALTGAEPEAAAGALLALGVAAIVVTLGGEGALLAEPSGIRHFAARPADVMDTSGAGDALCGVLVAQRAKGMPWDVALASAQEAAASTAERRGAFRPRGDGTTG